MITAIDTTQKPIITKPATQILSRIQNTQHSVEVAIQAARDSKHSNNHEDFRKGRKEAIQYLEPQYLRIRASHLQLKEWLQKRELGFARPPNMDTGHFQVLLETDPTKQSEP